MRDLILLCALLCTAPLILRAPVIGLLIWIWIALMNPQREVYSALSGAGLNFAVAAMTAISWALSKERKAPPISLVMVLLLLFSGWTIVSTRFAIDPFYSSPLLYRFLKTVVLCVAILALTIDRARLQAVIWMVAVSFGYYAVKGAGFVLATGGSHRVFGPESSMIADNNALGLALVITLPLLNYLRLTSLRRTTRLICVGTMACTFIAIIGTYSRGAMVALAVALTVYVVKSRPNVILMMGLVVAALSLPSLLPSGWTERMATLQTYGEDASFEGRVAAWRTSVNIAVARPLIGGGFSAVALDKAAQAYPSRDSLEHGRAAHSMYFEVLGDQGFVGLGLYLALLIAAWVNTSAVLGKARRRPELAWAGQLARMLQVSMAAFFVGGAALSMAYYDGFMVIIALTAALRQVVLRPSAALAANRAPLWKQDGALSPVPIAPPTA